MPIPSESRLQKLAGRTRFSPSELDQLGISTNDLGPFFMRGTDRNSALHDDPGNSGPEFRPLIKTKHGLIVAAPANISTAVRALLIDVATTYSLEQRLQFNLFQAKAELLQQSSFRYIPRGQVRVADGLMYCDQTFEISAGRHLHVLLSADGFENWPRRAFGSVTPHGEAWTEVLLERMRAAQASAKANPAFVGGMTLWMPSGWGAGRQFGFTPGDDLKDWMFLAAEAADIATIATCEDGKPSDLWRLQRQTLLVEEQGFKLMDINGLLNLFHWWRTTNYELVPPNAIDAAPPMMINFDTNLLLQARLEAFQKFGRRALKDETGRWHLVARLEREIRQKALDHVFGSLDDVMQAS